MNPPAKKKAAPKKAPAKRAARRRATTGEEGAAQALFDELAGAHLGRRGVSIGRIFHSEGLKINGKVFAVISRGRLLVKLPEQRVAELVRSGTASPFETRPGRVMREWVTLDMPSTAAGRRRWKGLMDEAATFVGSLTGKTRR